MPVRAQCFQNFRLDFSTLEGRVLPGNMKGKETTRRACVFCGSSTGASPDYLRVAEELGILLAERKTGLVYGGANVGLMGMVARSCLDRGGEVIGVMPDDLVSRELAREDLTELHIVQTMHERKALMNELSDSFITLPGGIGTLEETFEMFTAMQLGYHGKPIAFLNINGFYDRLFGFLSHTVEKGFLRPEHLQKIIVEDTVVRLLDRVEAYIHEPLGKWFDRDKNRID